MLKLKEIRVWASSGQVTIVVQEAEGINRGRMHEAVVSQADLEAKASETPGMDPRSDENCRAVAQAKLREQYNDSSIFVGLADPDPVAPAEDSAP